MKIAKTIIKFLAYLWIIWPITRGIITGIFGYGFGGFLSVVVMLGLIYYLEKNKIVTNLIERGFQLLNIGVQPGTQSLGTTSMNRGNGITIGASKITKSCPNCGAIMELMDGRGTCESCDTSFS